MTSFPPLPPLRTFHRAGHHRQSHQWSSVVQEWKRFTKTSRGEGGMTCFRLYLFPVLNKVFVLSVAPECWYLLFKIKSQESKRTNKQGDRRGKWLVLIISLYSHKSLYCHCLTGRLKVIKKFQCVFSVFKIQLYNLTQSKFGSTVCHVCIDLTQKKKKHYFLSFLNFFYVQFKYCSHNGKYIFKYTSIWFFSFSILDTIQPCSILLLQATQV